MLSLPRGVDGANDSSRFGGSGAFRIHSHILWPYVALRGLKAKGDAMPNTGSVNGKVAVVTGGASGIGKALASSLIARGMTVIIADVEREALDRAALEIGAVGIVTDVTSPQSVQALADEAKRRFGAVHVFCSNAGVASVGKIADMTATDWTWLLGVNLWGTIHGIRSFLPLLSANPDGGHLVVTASEAGFHAKPGLGGYSVTKYAVVGLVETLALELNAEESPVRVTLVCPGPVRTRLGSSQRNRPSRESGGALLDSNLEATEHGRLLRWMEPRDVAAVALKAMDSGEFYVFTHPEMYAAVKERHDQIATAFADGAARD